MTTPQFPGHPHTPTGASYPPPAHDGSFPPHPAAQPGCRICCGVPAKQMGIRAHQGLVLLMRFHKIDGPFCRTCGRALVREMTTKTLWQGWWSPLSLALFTPFTLVWNVVVYAKFSKLTPSAPAPGRRQLSEGQPIHQRPLAYIAFVPVVWALGLILFG